MELNFSFIIPVYNRPEEVDELLNSILELDYDRKFEVVIIEDGSSLSSKSIIDKYTDKIRITYFEKDNTGPGDSRNYGMRRSSGNYFIILDSDCLLPSHYLNTVEEHLKNSYVDCFGGTDTDHPTFTKVQKAINFAMTSFFTTGGIRGSKATQRSFQPRSFNMGISKTAFEATGGFGNIHPGEDPDLSLRLQKNGFNSSFIEGAYVHHKRRIDWGKFYKQVRKFGLARPVLNKWHSGSSRFTYWFPTFFSIGFILSLLSFILGYQWFLYAYIVYFIIVFLSAVIQTKSLVIATLSIFAVCVQFIGYGYGFLKSFILINLIKKTPQEALPELFFKNKS